MISADMTTDDERQGKHICTEFRRYRIDRKYVYRCDECKRDHTSDEMRTLVRAITIRPAES
jgi:hypothetical protein